MAKIPMCIQPCGHIISKEGADHLLKGKSWAKCPSAGCGVTFKRSSLVISERIMSEINRIKKKEDRKRKREQVAMSQLEVDSEEEEEED